MKQLTYLEAVRFHGHSGPLLALGYKAGKYAMERLKPQKMLDIKCSVKTIEKKPYTCIIDGIQCSTYCTVGKGNIKIEGISDERVEITFRCKEREVMLTLKPRILKRTLEPEDLEKEAKRVNEEPLESLFEIEENT